MIVSQPAATTTTWVGLALVALLLFSGLVLFAEGQVDAGNSLVSIAVGIVVGGGGVHLTK